MRVTVAVVAFVAAAQIAAQPLERTKAPRLWTDDALKEWALPVTGVNAAPTFYTEAEYYAAKVDELRTYPVYVKNREPKGYREGLLRRGPQVLIETGRARTEAEWTAAGRIVFEGMDLPENRTDASDALAWVDDPAKAEAEKALVTRDGVIVALRWVVDRDKKLKLTLGECSACHTRVLPDGTAISGAQGNINFNMSIFGLVFKQADEHRKKLGKYRTLSEDVVRQYSVPWLANDVNAGLKTMPEERLNQVFNLDTRGIFPRFNGSPFFMTRMPDLIGVKDRTYLDATGTHRNRGPEDIARYGILVTDADDGAIGQYRFTTAEARVLHERHSDDAMYALGKFVYSLQPPKNPNVPNELTARGEQVFTQSGCGNCHAPPLYTNNKLVPVDGFSRIDHPNSPAASDVLVGARLGLDSGLALKTRKGTGYYKVPSLKGLWYRDTLEHSGSIASLEEWFDPARVRADYKSKGWNPPETKTRAVTGHPFAMTLPAEDKRALIAFLRTL